MFNAIYLRDALISKASQLPANVVVDINTAEGMETLLFVLALSPEKLEEFNTEAQKKKGPTRLYFFAKSSDDDSESIELDSFSWKGKKVRFNGTTAPEGKYFSDTKFIDYVSVVFSE